MFAGQDPKTDVLVLCCMLLSGKHEYGHAAVPVTSAQQSAVEHRTRVSGASHKVVLHFDDAHDMRMMRPSHAHDLETARPEMHASSPTQLPCADAGTQGLC